MVEVRAAGRSTSARWWVLAAYALLAAATQMLWLTFAAIDTRTAPLLHVDVGTVGDLAAIFPGVYILLALPTGRWLDARFGQALGAGALLTAGGALLRLVEPTSIWWQFAGQAVIAAGQPLVLNAINKVAARHFPREQRAMAISVGTAALFVGILVAVLSAAPLLAAGGLSLLLGVQAGIGVVAAAAVLLALRVPAAGGDEAKVGGSLRWLLGDRLLWLLAGLVFIGMGAYNAVATYLEPVLDHFGEGWAAGDLVAVMTFAGIAGAAALPSLAAGRDRRRALLIAALGVTVVAFPMLALVHQVYWSGAWLAVEGFFLLAALPVVLDWAEVHAGPERQGSAVGFLMMAGNLGGLVLVLATQAVIGNAYLALGLLALFGVAGLPVALRLPERTAPTR